MRMFVRGTDGAVWTRSWNGSSWSGWSSLGGVATSGPVAMSRAGGVYDVFVRGGDNAYYHKYFTPAGGWSASWGRLGGAFLSAPGASLRQGTGEIDVVGVGGNQQLYHGYWASGSGWSGFAALGGGLSGRPSTVSPAPGIIDVWVRGDEPRPLPEVLDLGERLDRLHLPRRQPHQRRLRHGVGRQPARRLRPRRRQHRLRRLLPGAELGRLQRRSTARSAQRRARRRSAPGGSRWSRAAAR